MLDEIEAANARIHGYGSLNFGRNLRQCYQHLAEREVRDGDLETVMGFAERILECPMEVIEGVAETLAYLAPRHDLTLFTKGHPEEQKLKIDRSGLGRYFAHTAIVKEKDAAAYRALVETRGMEPERTWMIGNSPKSDINPALEAGLNAVFVPARPHLGAGTTGDSPGPGTPAGAGPVRRFALSFLVGGRSFFAVCQPPARVTPDPPLRQ